MYLWIIDTNIIVSGLISRDAQNPTASILNDMLTGGMVFILSPALLAEYRAVLLRPAIKNRHGLTEPQIDEILIELTANAKWSEPDADPEHFAPDLGDVHLWTLLACHPEASLITGDRLLLDQPRPGSRVILPADYKKQAQIRSLLNQPIATYRTGKAL